MTSFMFKASIYFEYLLQYTSGENTGPWNGLNSGVYITLVDDYIYSEYLSFAQTTLRTVMILWARLFTYTLPRRPLSHENPKTWYKHGL